MSASTTQSMPQDKFLTMAANILHKAFIESSRTRAKNAYKALILGKTVLLTTVQMEDKSTVRFNVALDYTEFRGTINYSTFRTSLALLLTSLSESLQKGEPLTVFSAHQDPNSMIFGVSAVTAEAENQNVMVLGADMGGGEPSVVLKLMYLDQEQFTIEPGNTA